MRCFALALRLRECGAQVSFIGRDLPGNLFALVEGAGFRQIVLPGVIQAPAEDARATALALAGSLADWLIVDGYALDAAWEMSMRAHARAILAIDDLADRPHDCDLLLDQNLFAEPAARYRALAPARARTLLGPRYALLREEFAQARAALRERDGKVNRILVSFGGADAGDFTSIALRALLLLERPRFDLDVVIGGAHASRQQVESVCAEHGYRCHVQTTRMAELMAAADFAIGAGGSTTWERCCLGLPALVVCAAANQIAVTAAAATQGLVFAPDLRALNPEALAAHLAGVLDDEDALRSMSKRCLATVDGQGAARVSRAMGISRVEIRRATAGDSPRVFEWRNHPRTRAVSSDTATLDVAEHQRWFDRTLTDRNRALLIGEVDGAPVGVVRFDIGVAGAEISIYLVPGCEGRGLGAELLCAAEFWLSGPFPQVGAVHARVLGHNDASHRMFASAGYETAADGYTKRMR